MSNSDAEVTDFNTAEQLSLSAREEVRLKLADVKEITAV